MTHWLRLSTPWLVLSAAALLLLGCGGPSGNGDLTAARVSETQLDMSRTESETGQTESETSRTEPAVSQTEPEVGRTEPERSAQATPAAAVTSVPTRMEDDPLDFSSASGRIEADAECVWLTEASGERLPVRWPSGTTRGEGGTALVDGAGAVLARVGDEVRLLGGLDFEPLETCGMGRQDHWSTYEVEVAP